MIAEKIIDEIIRREGRSYTNIIGDKGGPTRFGITLASLQEWRKATLRPDDVRNLTEEEARKIYRERYISEPGFYRITNPQLQELLVDCGVNHGQRRAVKWLQSAVDAKRDGNLGPITAGMANTLPPRIVFARVLCTRMRFYEDLDDVPSQAKFDMGWTNRCCEFVMILAGM